MAAVAQLYQQQSLKEPVQRFEPRCSQQVQKTRMVEQCHHPRHHHHRLPTQQEAAHWPVQAQQAAVAVVAVKADVVAEEAERLRTEIDWKCQDGAEAAEESLASLALEEVVVEPDLALVAAGEESSPDAKVGD